MSNSFEVLVSTCAKYEHLMPGMAYLFNKYMPEIIPVAVVTDAPPKYILPANFTWSVVPGKPWGEMMLKATEGRPVPGVLPLLFLFDDYWLRKPVDASRLHQMLRLLHDGVDKADLSNNTNYFEHQYFRPDLVAAKQDAPYRVSTQPAFWRTHYFRSTIRPQFNPWEYELANLAAGDGGVIVGRTDGAIYDYANVYLKGEPCGHMIETLSRTDADALKSSGLWPF